MKTRQLDETDNPTYSFFEATECGPMVIQPQAVLSLGVEEAFLDKFLSAVKWIFLYAPGVAYVHMLVVGFGMSLLYEFWPATMFVQILGAVVIGTFMIMLGVGKLNDLKYLRVVAGILAASSLAAIVFLVIAAFLHADFFGTFYKLSLPFVMMIGYLVKRYTDKLETPNT